MRLLKATVSNFGKIHSQEFDFSEGLNVFNQENGWGKTTLSVFIKSMFYGMEHTTSKDLEKNEKLKYKPWQGGSYGGSLEFEINEKKYKVTRFFEMKKNEDTFELRNLKTNKLSTDYSDDLGTEIFGVNRETYGRSVLVDLNETPAGSTDISAKLNNLVEAGDISDFDEAFQKLDRQATELKAKRGNSGMINLIQDKIDSNREYLEEINSKILQNESYISEMKEIKAEIEILEKEQKELTDKLSISAKYESKLHYDQLMNDVYSIEKEKKNALDFFNGTVPDDKLLSDISELSDIYTTVNSNIISQSATQSERDDYEVLKREFSGDTPTELQINQCLNADLLYKKYLQEESSKKLSDSEEIELSQLRTMFLGKTISKELISEKNQLIETSSTIDRDIQNLINEKKQKENELKIEKLKKPVNTKKIVFWGISIFLFIVSIVLFLITKNIVLGVILLGAAIISFLVGLKSKNIVVDTMELEQGINLLEEKIKNTQLKKEKIDNELYAFVNSIYPGNSVSNSIFTKMGIDFNNYESLLMKKKEYDNWLIKEKDACETNISQMKSFMKRYCKTEDISNISIEVQTLNSKLGRLHNLEKKINSDADNEQSKKETVEKLEKLLRQYQTQKNLSYSEQLKEITSKIAELKMIDSNLESAKEKVKAFEMDPNNDINSFGGLEKPEQSVDELNNLLADKTNKINEKNTDWAFYEKKLNDNLSVTEKKEDIETEIEKLMDEKHEKTIEYITLVRTRDLLKEAKENLDANYSDPMKEGFSKYVSMIGGKDNFIIDTDLKVSVDEKGNTYDSAYLSEGYKDIVNFCSRMALVDALFKDVKPTVILDDPFVNLDDDKIPKALELVSAMSEDKQVLYFTCHKSREL